MDRLFVHTRVQERHPELRAEDVVAAWNGALQSAPRIDKNPNEYVAIGFDRNGRLIEMVAARNRNGDWLIYHAKTPPTKKTMIELGANGR